MKNFRLLSLSRLLVWFEFLSRTITSAPRKKTSLEESLVESHAYIPIRDSGETLGEREKFR